MVRFLISDHHFGHENIIEYTSRPFTSVGQMNAVMLDRYYEVVSPADVLIHLGDVAMDMHRGDDTIAYFQRLDGDLLLRGNHDSGVDLDDAPFPVLESCVLAHGGCRFFCTHRPVDIPEEWPGWAIHGHEHDNHPAEFPFIAADARRINVSVEVLDYRPISLAELTRLLNRCPPGSRIPTLERARATLVDDADG